jgi:hypothetical protein
MLDANIQQAPHRRQEHHSRELVRYSSGAPAISVANGKNFKGCMELKEVVAFVARKYGTAIQSVMKPIGTAQLQK